MRIVLHTKDGRVITASNIDQILSLSLSSEASKTGNSLFFDPEEMVAVTIEQEGDVKVKFVEEVEETDGS